MDLKQIEKLMKAMEESRIKRVVLKQEGFEIEIERECAEGHLAASPPIYMHHQAPAQPQPAAPVEARSKMIEASQPAEAKTKSGNYVTSPMVGTFYAAPSPDDPPYVKVGDVVNENSVICIIEAMKVMNEVKAGMKGTVVEVLMKSGDPLEFGTRILRIEPA